MDEKRQLLRHTLATLAYRAAKPLRDAPPDFSTTRACPTCRTAGEILAHLGDLMDWALTAVQGDMKWAPVAPQEWDADVDRFFTALGRLDDYLDSDRPLGCLPEKLFQGPVADTLTHVGQLATLRRLGAAAVRGENYFIADIEVGRVGPQQAVPKFEFD